MTKGRSTTWQEQIDIVHNCLAHQHDYRKAAITVSGLLPSSVPVGKEVRGWGAGNVTGWPRAEKGGRRVNRNGSSEASHEEAGV
jgi:hypothetical protein